MTEQEAFKRKHLDHADDPEFTEAMKLFFLSAGVIGLFLMTALVYVVLSIVT